MPKAVQSIVCALALLSVVLGTHLDATRTGTRSNDTATMRPAGRSTTATELRGLKLISFVPVHGTWSSLWRKWDPGALDQTFKLVASLHANAVRIFVQPSAFGYPRPLPAMMARLETAVSIARSRGLKVQITLFDQWSDYVDLDGSAIWTAKVLAPFRNAHDIAFVELKNEVDPLNAVEMDWVRTELPLVRRLSGSVPVTVSVTGSNTPAELTDLKQALGPIRPAFFDIHFYGNPSDAYAQLSQDISIIEPSPLFVGEVGMSTALDPGETEKMAEAYQDLYLRSVEWATKALGLPPAAPWMLQDHWSGAALPGGQTTDYGSGYGLLKLSGADKPAAVSISKFFSTGAVATLFNGSFAGESSEQPLEWKPYDAGQGLLAWDGAVTHSRFGSVALSDTRGSPAAEPAYETSPIVVPTHPGEAFRLTAWAKGSSATGSNCIAISWFDADQVYLGQAQSAQLPSGSSGWGLLTVTSVAPPGAAYEEVHLKSSYNTGTVWFDDVTFTALN